ncbi:MAG TPA: DUF4423 domain-containing protein [Polyangiaceae bacterium]|nr:DUF4423 domain-containing protein [Polyangiaceae bacterium]
MHFETIASEWLRLIRGKRSQRGFSKRLGYSSNIAYRWESGICFPTAQRALRLAGLSGASGQNALRVFFGSTSMPAELEAADLATRGGVAALLRGVRGKTPLVELARRSGKSRFAIARWLSGATEPRLPELLSMIEAATFRLLDFLDSFTQVQRLPSVVDDFRALAAARNTAYDVPWSHAVLRALEIADYAELGKHRRGWIAKRLRITRAEEERCLRALSESRQVRLVDGLWRVEQTRTIDTRADPSRARRLRAEWLKVALSRLREGVTGSFGYNVMALSRADLGKLKELHQAYFRSMQALVAASKTSECVVLFNTQLFALDDAPP